MLFGSHLDVVLGEAKGAMFGKEGAIATIQDVHLGIGQFGVFVDVDSTVLVADILGPMVPVSLLGCCG